ncbi:MAG TPA: hypothetical protein VIQ77_11360 [Mucilaginibacter sp.]|jgi:Protein of unknown function, DUF255.
MKRYLLLILAIAQMHHSFGQEIKYQKTFAQALNLAGKENKPIFIYFTAKNVHLPDSLHIKPDGFTSPKVASLYNKNFINFTIDISDSTGVKTKNMFYPDAFPAYIFLDSKGQLVYKASGVTNPVDKYIEFAETALQRIKSGNTIAQFELLDKEGKLTTSAQLKKIMDLRRELNMPDDQSLLDRYVATLNIKDLDNYGTVLYILKAGPLANSKTYTLIYSNRKLIDSIFKKEALTTRIAINTRIISNSRNLAIKNKDAALAQSSANIARYTWGKDYQKANKTYTAEMLMYYKGVKDTLNYFNTADYYYDSYYLNISADSARRSSVYAPEAINLSPKSVFTPNSSGVILTTHVIKTSPYSSVAATLNNVAWDFYTMGTHNRLHLLKALMWSKRATELDAQYSYYDTMAHIMYQLNFIDEALMNQQKAINIALATPAVSQTEMQYLKGELKKMQDLLL